MSFTNVVNSTATIPYDMNDNFIHVAQGSITPKNGTSLEETSSSLNIGSSVNKWNNGYFSGSIHCDTITSEINTFKLVYSLTLTLSTDKIEITGLDGDNDLHYFINHQSTQTGGASSLFFNNDSTAAHYYGGVAFAIAYGINNIYINAISSKIKSLWINRGFGQYLSSYYNQLNTLTSMQIIAVDKLMSGTTIRVYKYGLD